MNRLIAGIALLGLLLAAPAALALEGDCDGDGELTRADIETLDAAQGTVEGDADFPANCDLDGDGAISLADLGRRLDLE